MRFRIQGGRNVFTSPGIAGLWCLFLLKISAGHSQDSLMSDARFQVSIGHSREAFDWSIAGRNAQGEKINVFSELRWQKLRAVVVELDGEVRIWKNFFLLGRLSKSFISSGDVSDTDFGQNNRKDTLFYDAFDADKGGCIDASVTLGYKIPLLKKHAVTLSLGYGTAMQSFYLLRNNGNVQGDLKSTYQSQWNGIVARIDLQLRLLEKLAFKTQAMYQHAIYSAEADWNLIESFRHPVSFKHRAKGYTFSTSAQVAYLISKTFSVSVGVQSTRSETGNGTDMLFLKSGDVLKTKLNPVHRDAATLSVGVELKL